MLDDIFDGSFMPHGHCLLWREDLLFMTLLGDGLTFTAYFIIPILLISFVRRREDLKFNRIFLLFAAFIAFCGMTHAIGILNVWHGYYYLQGLAKLATGFVSIMTAVALWKLMPKILAIPSMKMLKEQNLQLSVAQANLEDANRNLEQKVKERTEKLEKLANTDQLTQINNRRAILKILEQEFLRMERHPHDLSLLMLDIDHFKAVNDTYGHLEGDKVLIKVAEIISETCRQTDAVGRYGGEEFLVLLPETTNADAKELAERIRLSVSKCKAVSGRELTCSIGVSSLTKGKTVQDLIKEADDRTYKAKDQGRNQVVHLD